MIKAYLLGIKSLYEGESIEVKYRVFDGDKLIIKKNEELAYSKPILVGHIGMLRLLRDLKEYMNEEIVVYINDGALYETINQTSGTKKVSLLRKAKDTRMELEKFKNLEIINIDGKHEMVKEWNEALKK